MNTPTLHLCIATGQNLANLIPALQCQAREVWVLQTPAMRDSAAHLADALKARGIAVQRIDFADDDVTALHAQAERIAERLDGKPVTINLSGGTKLMTLALVQTLAEHLKTAPGEGPHLVYTDTLHRRLDWLAPAPRSEPMASVLKINDMLLAQGYRRQGGSGGAGAAEWQRRAIERERVTRFFGDRARALGPLVGALNRAARQALGDGRTWLPQQELHAHASEALELLQLAQKQGLLHWNGRTQLTFRDRDAAEYLGGGWVEEFAGAKISGARADDDDWAPRLEVEHVDSKVRNEIDAVLVHRNRMLVVECKSARADVEDVGPWIYKLSQLAAQVGGSHARALLLSARELREHDLKRAGEYKVDVLHGAELGTLAEYLRRWMNGD
jgi:hypothetical protein